MMFFAQVVVERVVNSLPEGLLIALGAWLLLRLMGRQNSGTRFAVWMVALAGVVALPVLSGLGSAKDLPRLISHAHPEIAVPAFWAAAFFVAWISIAVIALARVVAGVWQVRQIRRSCTEIPAVDLDPTLRELVAEANRPVRLLTSEKARVPAALGFRNPAIVIPAWALRDLTTAELRPVLIHELAHLRRRDDWTNLFQKAIRALLFFHPAVWWIDARLSLEREMACDDAVVAATGNPRAYAGCLIELLEKSCERRGWSMAQAAVARARDASLRIARILRVGSAATTRVGRTALGVAVAVSLACVGVALCSPRLVEFVPANSTSAALSSRPTVGNTIQFPSVGVIPAAWHPAEKPALVHDAVVKPKARPHRAAVRQASALKPRMSQTPLVRASLATPNEATPAPAPMFVVFEATSSAPDLMRPAQLQTIAEQQFLMATQLLRSREEPALQIQVLQAIDPATGNPVQVFRLVLVVPQEDGLVSSSI